MSSHRATRKQGYRNIVVEHGEHGVTIRLNRPEKRNPLDWDTVKELRDSVVALQQDKQVMTVVVTGSGEAFSAGGDLEKYLTLFRSRADFRGFLEDFYELFKAMETASAIYVAAVNGICVAGGLELMLACDIVLSADDARIGDGHLNFGQLPGAGSSIRLWRSLGVHRAKYLMLTGNLLSAQECQQIGLVNEVHPSDRLQAGIDALLAKLHAKSPVGLCRAKRLLNAAVRLDLENGLRTEIDVVHQYATEEGDPIEGLMAFKEKRKPQFGRLS